MCSVVSHSVEVLYVKSKINPANQNNPDVIIFTKLANRKQSWDDSGIDLILVDIKNYVLALHFAFYKYIIV